MVVGEEGEKGGLLTLELAEVAVIVIGLSGLPAAEEDADPLEGQCSDGGVVTMSFAAEQGVIGFGPAAVDQ
jgi:hypothetical protein